MSEPIYPISEIFTSPQGEGRWAGHLMTFIRLAGCSVGKPYPKSRYTDPVCSGKCDVDMGHLRDCPMATTVKLPIYTEMCTLYDGRTFECDTDYRVKERLTVSEIIARVDAPRVCISGGEPLIHDLLALVEACDNIANVHIETSGTRSLRVANLEHVEAYGHIWIAVSPKKGARPDMIDRADEIKLLVDADFDETMLPVSMVMKDNVYIQPVNFEHTINSANMKRCIELQKKHKNWIISSQSHKTWNVR